jgi:uncharacterized membrane-anchored protein YhcB (DUF1043 family)
MIKDILAFWTPGPVELLVILIFFGIPIVLIVLFIRHLSRISKERQKFRLELDKLADELEQVRKQKEEGLKDKSSTESG